MNHLRFDNGECDESRLAALEAQLRVQFPSQYRKWLLATNGGVAVGMPWFVVPDNPRSSEEVLRTLYGVVPDHREQDIESNIRDGLWILRQNHFPIGYCEGSGILSMRLGARDETVYFFEVLDELTEDGLRTPYFVARNIDAFIDSLKA